MNGMAAVSGGGVTRRQCDRSAAKSAARVAAVGGSWRHLGGNLGGTELSSVHSSDQTRCESSRSDGYIEVVELS